MVVLLVGDLGAVGGGGLLVPEVQQAQEPRAGVRGEPEVPRDGDLLVGGQGTLADQPEVVLGAARDEGLQQRVRAAAPAHVAAHGALLAGVDE